MTVDIIAYFSFFCIVPSRQKIVRNCLKRILGRRQTPAQYRRAHFTA